MSRPPAPPRSPRDPESPPSAAAEAAPDTPGLPGCSSWATVYTGVLLVFAAVVAALTLWTHTFV